MINASGRERTKQPVTLFLDVSLVRVASTSGGGATVAAAADADVVVLVLFEVSWTSLSEAVGGIGEPGGGGEVERSCGLLARQEASMRARRGGEWWWSCCDCVSVNIRVSMGGAFYWLLDMPLTIFALCCIYETMRQGFKRNELRTLLQAILD